MILLNDQIIGLLKKPRNEDLIKRAVEIYKSHRLHVKGEGLFEFLSKIEGYENQTQLDLRRKLAKPSTVPIFGKETDLQNKIFTAQGTNKYYQLSSEKLELDFKTYLSTDIGEGLTITQWMRDIWLDKVNYDTTGVVMGELPMEANGLPEPYVTFRSILDIHDIYFKGNKIEYIIFKTESIIMDKKVCTFRVIDDAFDFIYEERDGAYVLNQEKTIPNHWGYVPCKIISNQRDWCSDARTSYIWKAIDSANEYLLDSSIHTIGKKLLGFPRYWERQRACRKCNGDKRILHKDGDTDVYIACTECSGTGVNMKTDVSDKFVVPMLEAQGQPDNVPVGGFITIDNETPAKQVEEMDRLQKMIHVGIWADNQKEISLSTKTDGTATGAMLDVQAYWDKLAILSENAQEIELFICNLLGEVRYGSNYKGSVINYGKRYFIRSADEVEQLYMTAKNSGLPSHLLDAYIEELIYIRFGNDPLELDEQLKLNAIEPFIHLSTKEVKEMGVSQEDFFLKLYFTDYIERYEREVKPLSISSSDEILAKITQYNQEKLKTVQTPVISIVPNPQQQAQGFN